MTPKHVYEVTTASGHKDRIRAARFDITDQIVIFDAKKGDKAGQSGVAAFPVGQLGSVVRADMTSRSGNAASSTKSGPRAKSSTKTSTATTRRRPHSSNGSAPARASKSKAKSRARARGAR